MLEDQKPNATSGAICDPKEMQGKWPQVMPLHAQGSFPQRNNRQMMENS